MNKSNRTLFLMLTSCLVFIGCVVALDLITPEKPGADAYRFECEGHSYLRIWSRAKSQSGIVHDPDCKCYEARVNNIVAQVMERTQKNNETKPSSKNGKDGAHRYIVMPTTVEAVK